LYVLDPHMQPVPPGVPGELFIGGHCVARGYLNRPDLTAERFVPDLFSGSPDDRLYRTGDLARYRPDGVLEYLGRRDDQVKLRGYRIELGEVEAVLLRHPEIREAAVVVEDDQARGKHLAAYVVPERTPGPDTGELRRLLASALPPYMLPATFALLDELPLSANGKVNRGALAACGQPQPARSSAYVEPRTETERRLADIWAVVLGVPRVGVHDNFFELGGHSLLATRLVSRIRDELRIELPLPALFEAPTVAELAPTLTQAAGVGRFPVDQPIPRLDRASEAELVDLDRLSDAEVDALLARSLGLGDDPQLDRERMP
jgi:acyl carrier protein